MAVLAVGDPVCQGIPGPRSGCYDTVIVFHPSPSFDVLSKNKPLPRRLPCPRSHRRCFPRRLPQRCGTPTTIVCITQAYSELVRDSRDLWRNTSHVQYRSGCPTGNPNKDGRGCSLLNLNRIHKTPFVPLKLRFSLQFTDGCLCEVGEAAPLVRLGEARLGRRPAPP